MKHLSSILLFGLTILLSLINLCVFAQVDATGLKVHAILQENCSSCHQNNDSAVDLGLGGMLSATLYDHALDLIPANNVAAHKGDQLLMSRYPYRNFLWQKTHSNTYLADCHWTETEQALDSSSNQLTNVEIAIIQQWILADTSPKVKFNEYVIENRIANLALPNFSTEF